MSTTMAESPFLNQDLLACRPHPSKKISDAIAGDPTIVNLTVGEPGYGPPAVVLDRLVARLGERTEDPSPSYDRYTHSRGLPALRQAIAGYYRRRYDLEVDPDSEVLVTNGGAGALWLTVFTLTNPGDEVVIPDPCYMLFEPIVKVLGRRPVRIATRPERRFRLDPADFEAHLSERTKLLMLNSPENPTGTVYDRSTLEELLGIVEDRGIHLMHDEVFDSLFFEGEHVPARLLEPETRRTILVNSFSKRFGMTGWRIGWMLAHPDIVDAATKAHTFQCLAGGTLVQEGAAAGLADPTTDTLVARHCSELQAKSLRFLEKLTAIDGFDLPAGPPRGGFYAFVDVRSLYQRLLAIGEEPGPESEVVARYLLEHAKVGVVPGNGFGAGGEGFVRISYAAPEAHLDDAVKRLRSLRQRLGS
ncbi:MAG: pyridoxal phosphate-dependent aminotransferase [Acidobacteriota bacterium]|nr:pyridoxal phosphate-dependent aminotransferase [Acidobacteriota bacterium]